MAISRDMWERFAKARRSIYEKYGKPMFPVDGMPQYVIPAATYLHEDTVELKRLQRALYCVDRDFELIYDPLTALPGQPAYHLYSLDRNAFPGGVARLNLEFSIQRERGKEWPEGIPCKPDWSHVQRAKSSYKGNSAGDVARANKDAAERIAAVNSKIELAQYKKDADLEDYMWREIWNPYLVKQKVMPRGWRGMERGHTPNRTSMGMAQSGGNWKRGKAGLWTK